MQELHCAHALTLLQHASTRLTANLQFVYCKDILKIFTVKVRTYGLFQHKHQQAEAGAHEQAQAGTRTRTFYKGGAHNNLRVDAWTRVCVHMHA
eukprot:36265-Pleurochrysis_carterae.AAC.1